MSEGASNRRMKSRSFAGLSAVAVLVLSAGLAATGFAHPGHGVADGANTFFHYLSAPSHAPTGFLALIAVCVPVTIYAIRDRAKRRSATIR